MEPGWLGGPEEHTLLRAILHDQLGLRWPKDIPLVQISLNAEQQRTVPESGRHKWPRHVWTNDPSLLMSGRFLLKNQQPILGRSLDAQQKYFAPLFLKSFPSGYSFDRSTTLFASPIGCAVGRTRLRADRTGGRYSQWDRPFPEASDAVRPGTETAPKAPRLSRARAKTNGTSDEFEPR